MPQVARRGCSPLLGQSSLNRPGFLNRSEDGAMEDGASTQLSEITRSKLHILRDTTRVNTDLGWHALLNDGRWQDLTLGLLLRKGTVGGEARCS